MTGYHLSVSSSGSCRSMDSMVSVGLTWPPAARLSLPSCHQRPCIPCHWQTVRCIWHAQPILDAGEDVARVSAIQQCQAGTREAFCVALVSFAAPLNMAAVTAATGAHLPTASGVCATGMVWRPPSGTSGCLMSIQMKRSTGLTSRMYDTG